MGRQVDIDDVVGVHEACLIIGLTDGRLSQLLKHDPDFPKPIAEVRATKLWLRGDLELWLKNRVKRGPGRPTKAAKAAEAQALGRLGNGQAR